MDGQKYVMLNATVHPVPGEVVGNSRIPGCNDTGQASAPPDELRSVARLPGVRPADAVVDAEVPEIIYVSAELPTAPSGVERFMTAPTCAPDGAPIDLEGPWLSIPGTDANVEPDPVPPYRVEMLVTSSSAPEYLNAELEILVPPALGTPITHEDVRSALWTGGTIHVVATCRGDRFIATAIATSPPA